MGSYDCYCILCAGTLDIQAVTIGSMKEKNLRKRDRNVGIATGRLADTSDGENSCSSGTDSEEDDSGAEDAPDDEARKKRLNELQKQNEDDTGSDFEDEHGTSNSEYSEYSEDTESVDSNDFDLLAGATEITDVAMRPRTPEPKPTEERDSDSWSQTSDLSFDFDEVLLKDDAIEWDEDSFDPRLISREDLLWLNRSRALALNHKSDPENPKAYVSGRGRYEGLGTFVVRKAGRDPNDANVSVLDVTAYSDGEENMAFPFHEACFNIFANSMGHEKGHEVNKDVMWEVMRAHLVDERPALDVKYGYSMAHEQFWVNVPGEEYVVCDPGPRPSLRGKIPELLSGSILNRATEVLDLSNKVRSDPTQILPYDILLEIIGYMDTKDMLSFMKASYHVNSYTREAAFWQHMIHVRILPWFNELGHFVENTSTDATDYKSLFLWSDALTRPDIGNQGPLMHIANRRRIWECCQPLASLYKRLVGPVEPAEPENSDEAKAILEASVCLSTPMTMYPSPNDSETTSARFVHAWYEIGHRSCVLDTYWRHDPSQNLFLVGISITLGGQRRLFGSAEGSLGRPLHIERGEWINQIICDIDEIDIFSRNSPNYDWSTYGRPEEVKSLTTCLIRDLQIKMTTGREKSVMNHRLATSQRPLVVLDNMRLVGLTGQIASNGAISRLGLLQASRLDSATTARLQYDTTQQLFWKYLTRLPYQQRQYPIWSHPSYHHALFPMSTRISPFDPPEEMIPHDIFLWNKTCIEVFQPGGATIFNLPNQTVDGESAKESVPSTSATTTTCPITSPFPGTEASCTNTTSPSYQFQSSHEIAAINSGRTKIYSNQNSFVGCQTAAPAQHPRWTLDMNPHEETFRELWTELSRQNSQQYDPKTGAFKPSYEKDNIAFPLNNESITEVHVEHQYRALKLVTQSGRVGYFGLPGCKDWWVRKAVEGERFVGMSTCFGSLGGWSQTAMRWSHWKLSRVGVFFERVDEDGEVVSKEKQKILENNGDGKVFEQGKIEIVTTEEEDVA